MGTDVVAALAAGALAWLAVDDPGGALGRRLAAARAGDVGRPGGGRRGRWVRVAGIAVLVVGAALIGGRAAATLAVLGTIATGAGDVLLRRAKSRREAGRAAEETARAAETLAGLLRVGVLPAAAVAAVARDHPVLAEAAALQAVGGEPVGALRRAADAPGCEGLRDLAAAWEVAARTGASMSATLEAIADDLARRQESTSTVAVELAASRSAGRMLAALPAAGVLLGYGFGGDPLAFLLGNPVGELCLIVAAGLMAAGLLWTDVLAERAAR